MSRARSRMGLVDPLRRAARRPVLRARSEHRRRRATGSSGSGRRARLWACFGLRHLDRARMPWVLVLIGQVCFLAGDTAWFVQYDLVDTDRLPYLGDCLLPRWATSRSPSDCCCSCGSQRRRGNLAGVVDGLIVSIGAGVLLWTQVVSPAVYADDVATIDRIINIGIPDERSVAAGHRRASGGAPHPLAGCEHVRRRTRHAADRRRLVPRVARRRSLLRRSSRRPVLVVELLAVRRRGPPRWVRPPSPSATTARRRRSAGGGSRCSPLPHSEHPCALGRAGAIGTDLQLVALLGAHHRAVPARGGRTPGDRRPVSSRAIVGNSGSTRCTISLTGLANRNLFSATVTTSLERNGRERDRGARRSTSTTSRA